MKITYREKKDAQGDFIYEVYVEGNKMGEIRSTGFERFQYFAGKDEPESRVFRSPQACKDYLEGK